MLMRPGEHRSDNVDTFFAHALEYIPQIVEYFEKLDPTEVLQISRDANGDEIRKAYRKAALANHPDKVSEEERETASIRFKDVQQAYEILSDDDKRHLYNTHGMGAFNGSGEPGMNGGPGLDGILAQMFGMGAMGGMGGVSLCKGKGGKEKATAKKCSTCDGQDSCHIRFREILTRMGQFLTKSTAVCTTCNGDGQFFATKDKCKKCKGKKTNEEKKILEIYIPRGAKDGDRIVLEGEADQVPGQEPGDIVFQLEQEEHPVFTRAGADLKATIDVTLAESLTGLSRVVIKHLDGRGIELQHPKTPGQILSPGQVFKVPGEGMPIKRSDSRGDLYLVVNIKFPDEKMEAQRCNSGDVEYEANANIDDFGSQDPSGGDAWEDDDEEEGGSQCAT
ncbi:hypothetical protein BDV18DRAFT_165413 [Aspergillus unguis]